MIAVFNTNIVIDALKGLSEAHDEYTRYERVLISRITWMEVLVGARNDAAQLRDFLDTHFNVVPLNLPVAERAVDLRCAHRMRLPDAIIWATAQIHDAILVLRNTKDFNAGWDGMRVPYTL